MMKHIVQFTISFDDETIKKRLEENAYDDIVSKIYEEVEPKVTELLKMPRYTNNPTERIVESCVKEIVEKNKDEIIQRVIGRVENKVYRSGKMKEEILKMKVRNEK